MKIVAALAGSLLLAGCISLGAKPPKALLTLTPAAMTPAGTTRTADSGDTITVLAPVVPAALATARIPVYDGGSELAYVKDAAWNEPPARLFQRVLSETVAVRTGKVVLDFRQSSLDPGTRVSGQLMRFGIDPVAMQAVVIYDGIVSRAKGGIATRRFEARAPIAVIEGRVVGSALNTAGNDVAVQVADWVK